MTTKTFKQMHLDDVVLKSLEDMGFEIPTEIQEKAIPILLKSKKDFVGQAQTGTGKTAAFVIPLLQKIDFDSPVVQALILTPTRELANQVENEIGKIGKYTAVKSCCIYGGTGYDKQIRSLKKDKPQIVVGTPGRVIDLINKGILKLNKASFCVLDEADEMLNMGFLEDVQTILESFHGKRQLVMFSATMPKPILKLIDSTFNAYDLVQIEKKSLSNADIEQKYFLVRDKHHKEALARLIESADEDVYALIFCRTRIETKEVGDDLKKRGLNVEVLHGDMGQNERDHAMRKFKEKKVNLMVCTDVAARGIDVTNLTHVFNFGLPQDNESYVHRIGRTGRAGLKGKAYLIIGAKSRFAIKRIEKHINSTIEFAHLPKVKEIKRKIIEKELSTAAQILDAIKEKGDEFKLDDAYELFEEQFKKLKKDDLLKLMFTWKFNKTLRHYNNLSDIEGSTKASDNKKSSERSYNRNQKRNDRRRRGRSYSAKSNSNSNSGSNRAGNGSRGRKSSTGRSNRKRK